MKILVTSIRFANEGKNLLGKDDESRSLVVSLNTGKTVIIYLDGVFLVYHLSEGSKLTEAEQDVCRLVYDACRGWLHFWEPETMDGLALSAAGELAEERIDWEAAGYGDEGEEGEKDFCLKDKIAHFEDL